MTDLNAKIYVAGHTGMVGSAIVRALKAKNYRNIITRNREDLDLLEQSAVQAFFAKERPDQVYLAAAKVGGIFANSEYPAEFIYENLSIQTNIIHAAYLNDVKRLLFLGSSCIYPKLAAQPIKEEYLLTGSLEPSNRPYAIAKIAGIEMCWSYNRQYAPRYLAVMPTNLFGPGDNYHLENSHVIPALIRKFHEAKLKNSSEVVVWGTGNQRREFLFCDDMADACSHLMNLPDEKFASLLSLDAPPLVNIGIGEDLSIRRLAEIISEVVGYKGEIIFDSSKPDGTPRKLMDVSILRSIDWRAGTGLVQGLELTYSDYCATHPHQSRL